jgi:hypothetical protein
MVSEFDELFMCPIHVGGCDPLLCGYGSGVNDDQQTWLPPQYQKLIRTGFRRLPRRASLVEALVYLHSWTLLRSL